VAARTNLTAEDLPDNLSAIRMEIEGRIPHGRTNNGKPGDRGAWENPPYEVTKAFTPLSQRLDKIVEEQPGLVRSGTVNQRSRCHMGTLGTGNHFVEICLDEAGAVWAMLHSGSRGIGNAIGMYFIKRAKDDMRTWFVDLPDKDLAYLAEGTEHFEDYIEAVEWAQEFAAASRTVMLQETLRALASVLHRPVEAMEEAVNCHHNYVARENHYGSNVWVTRKGAVRARQDDLGIIPGSMGAKSFIVRGRGNADSFHSCSHGAGRVMSRNEAKRRFTLADHEAATEGVECRKDADVIDETPGAYKNIDEVMAAQTDLVDVVHTLKQVVCVKG